MITFDIVGTESAVHRLEAKGAFMQAELRRAVQALTIELAAKVKLKLSDDVLRVRTGRLRRSITTRVEQDEGTNGIYGVVGTNVEYAKIHEFGFSGSQPVAAHLRTITQAFGRDIASTTFQVGAHTRQVNIPERSFLRSTLDEMKPKIMADLQKAAADAARE